MDKSYVRADNRCAQDGPAAANAFLNPPSAARGRGASVRETYGADGALVTRLCKRKLSNRTMSLARSDMALRITLSNETKVLRACLLPCCHPSLALFVFPAALLCSASLSSSRCAHRHRCLSARSLRTSTCPVRGCCRASATRRAAPTSTARRAARSRLGSSRSSLCSLFSSCVITSSLRESRHTAVCADERSQVELTRTREMAGSDGAGPVRCVVCCCHLSRCVCVRDVWQARD